MLSITGEMRGLKPGYGRSGVIYHLLCVLRPSGYALPERLICPTEPANQEIGRRCSRRFARFLPVLGGHSVGERVERRAVPHALTNVRFFDNQQQDGPCCFVVWPRVLQRYVVGGQPEGLDDVVHGRPRAGFDQAKFGDNCADADHGHGTLTAFDLLAQIHCRLLQAGDLETPYMR